MDEELMNIKTKEEMVQKLNVLKKQDYGDSGSNNYGKTCEDMMNAILHPCQVFGRFVFYHNRLIELENSSLRNIALCGFISTDYKKFYKKWSKPKVIWTETQ